MPAFIKHVDGQQVHRLLHIFFYELHCATLRTVYSHRKPRCPERIFLPVLLAYIQTAHDVPFNEGLGDVGPLAVSKVQRHSL